MVRNSEVITVKIFDVIDEMKGRQPAEGTRSNLLYEAGEFNLRRIELSPQDEILPCKMAYNVVFNSFSTELNFSYIFRDY